MKMPIDQKRPISILIKYPTKSTRQWVMFFEDKMLDTLLRKRGRHPFDNSFLMPFNIDLHELKDLVDTKYVIERLCSHFMTIGGFDRDPGDSGVTREFGRLVKHRRSRLVGESTRLEANPAITE